MVFHFHFAWLVFEGSISTYACFHSENILVTVPVGFSEIVRQKKGSRGGQGEIHGQSSTKVQDYFCKAESANSLPFAVPFHVGAYFCMGAYKRDGVVVIKKWAPIFMGCLFCVGAYYPDFTVA